MWVLLRLLTAAAAGLLKFLRRRKGGGQRKRTGEIDWAVKQVLSNGRAIATTFGVALPQPLALQFAHEGGIDRFFKRLGFSEEAQTGDAEFDARVYIACDHPAVAALLRDHAEVRAAILALLTRESTKRLYTDGAHLWVERSGGAMPDEATLQRLAQLRDALQAVPAERLTVLRDPFLHRALLIEAIGWALAWYGLPVLLESGLRPHPLYFDWSPVIWRGLGLAVALWIILFALARLLLRGSSRAHRVLTGSAFILVLGVPPSAIQMVSDANTRLDRSAPTVLRPVILQRQLHADGDGRGGQVFRYTLRLEPLADAPVPLPAELKVTPDLYDAVRDGRRLAITLRHGALGVPWVENIAAAP